MLESRIVRRGNAFLIEISGETLPMYGYISYQPAKAEYADFKAAGVRLFFTGVYAGDRGINQSSGIRPFRPGFWKGPGVYDFSAADEDFRLITGDSLPGQIYIIPRLMLEVPSWWEELHPDECCRDFQGVPVHQSYSSKVWLSDAKDVMIAFRDWLSLSGWDRYVAGWHLAGGNTEEFILPRLHPMQFTDYSKPAESAFRVWLREKYGKIEALNTAWKTALTEFEQAAVPSPARRQYALNGALRNEESEAQVIDYYRFHSESLAKAITGLCAAAKEITQRKQVTGAFYGYTVNVPDPDYGHHAQKAVLECPDVDFLASPFTYVDNRAQGVDWPFQGAVDSAFLHDKPWFMEADIRTFLSKPISRCMTFSDPPVSRVYDGPVWLGPGTLEGSLGQMKKAFARLLTCNTAAWWFDMWGGWYKNPELMDFQEKAAQIYAEVMQAGGCDQKAQIAVFADEEQYARMAPGSPYTAQTVYEFLQQAGFVGAPYQLYLMSDFENVPPDKFRMAVFLSCRWTETRKKTLGRWKKNDRVLLFTGPYDQSAITGIPCGGDGELITAPAYLGQRAPGFEVRNIRFTPDRTCVPIARDALGEPVLALRRYGDYTVAHSLPLVVPNGLLRNLALAAGVHVYTFGGDAAYAGGGFVAVHACSDGEKRICIPKKGRLVEVFSGKTLPGNETYADVQMKFGETLLLRITD